MIYTKFSTMVHAGARVLDRHAAQLQCRQV
eukprot:SAG31_NODE_30023_length_386_cov_1.069686_1_plen_29_part_10